MPNRIGFQISLVHVAGPWQEFFPFRALLSMRVWGGTPCEYLAIVECLSLLRLLVDIPFPMPFYLTFRAGMEEERSHKLFKHFFYSVGRKRKSHCHIGRDTTQNMFELDDSPGKWELLRFPLLWKASTRSLKWSFFGCPWKRGTPRDFLGRISSPANQRSLFFSSFDL